MNAIDRQATLVDGGALNRLLTALSQHSSPRCGVELGNPPCLPCQRRVKFTSDQMNPGDGIMVDISRRLVIKATGAVGATLLPIPITNAQPSEHQHEVPGAPSAAKPVEAAAGGSEHWH